MCQIYASASQNRYDTDCRSIRIQGCVTSIRLENEFWEILGQMAEGDGQSVPQFINVLYDEILATHQEVKNFSSFLRVACAIYLHQNTHAELTL